MGDSLKRNGLVPIKATKENDYLVRIVVPRSAGEEKAGQAFNEIFHDLGILPAEISLSCGDWSNYCGFFLDEDIDAYFAILNHPDAMQFKKGTEKLKKRHLEFEFEGDDEVSVPWFDVLHYHGAKSKGAS